MSAMLLLPQMIMIFLEIALGYACAKLGVITDRDSKFLSNFILLILCPCTMLAGSSVEGGRETVFLMVQGFFLMLGLYLVSTAVCSAAAKLLHFSAGKRAVLIGAAAMPNCGFIGIPLVTALLGSQLGIVYPTAAMASYNLWFFTYVTSLFHPGRKPEPKSLITPTNIATVVMIFLLAAGIRLPAPIHSFVSAVGNCTVPLALMIIGVMLAGSDLKTLFMRPYLYLVTVLRGLVFPLLFMLVLKLLPLDRTMCLALAAIASCPAGSLTAVLAKQSGMEEELAGQSVAQSTMFMIVTVPLMLSAAGKLFGAG